MTIVTMRGRKEGLAKIDLNHAIRQHSLTTSLSEAKFAVDQLLAGKEVSLRFSSDKARDEFVKAAEKRGVIFEK